MLPARTHAPGPPTGGWRAPRRARWPSRALAAQTDYLPHRPCMVCAVRERSVRCPVAGAGGRRGGERAGRLSVPAHQRAGCGRRRGQRTGNAAGPEAADPTVAARGAQPARPGRSTTPYTGQPAAHTLRPDHQDLRAVRSLRQQPTCPDDHPVTEVAHSRSGGKRSPIAGAFRCPTCRGNWVWQVPLVVPNTRDKWEQRPDTLAGADTAAGHAGGGGYGGRPGNGGRTRQRRPATGTAVSVGAGPHRPHRPSTYHTDRALSVR